MPERQPLKVTLRAARVNAGLTQRTAAISLGISPDVVSNWERYKTYPDASMIPKLETLYGVKYEDILFLPLNNALSVNKREISKSS